MNTNASLVGFCRRKNSYPFNRLEQLITSFLSAFNSLTSHILSSIAPLQDARLGSTQGDLSQGKLANQEVLSKKNEAVVHALEKWLESCVAGHSSNDYDSLFFEFHYLTGTTRFQWCKAVSICLFVVSQVIVHSACPHSPWSRVKSCNMICDSEIICS